MIKFTLFTNTYCVHSNIALSSLNVIKIKNLTVLFVGSVVTIVVYQLSFII